MTFTPSATSSFSAGAVFWGMVWATLGKLNELAHFVGFKKSNPRQTAPAENELVADGVKVISWPPVPAVCRTQHSLPLN